MPESAPVSFDELRRAIAFCGRTALALVDQSDLVIEVVIAGELGDQVESLPGRRLEDWRLERKGIARETFQLADRPEAAVLLSRASLPPSITSQLLDHAEQLTQLGCFNWDLRTHELRWSDGLYRIFGLDPEDHEPSFERFLESVEPEDRARVESAIQQALKTGTGFENVERIRKPSGELRYLESRGQVVLGEDGQSVRMIGVCRDVTRRTAYEKTQVWQIEGLKLLAAWAGMRNVHDEDQWRPMLGKVAAHLGCESFALHTFDGDRLSLQLIAGVGQPVVEKLASLELGETAVGRCGETRSQSHLQNESGSLDGMGAETLVVSPLLLDNQLLGTVAFFSQTRGAFRSAELDFVQTFAGILSDFTARSRFEERMLASQRMEAAGRLAGVVAHDFNNLLTVISTYAELLNASAAAGTLKQPIQSILEATERASDLTSQLRMFGRRSPQDVKMLNLNDVLIECRPLMKSLAGKDITVETHLAKHVSLFRADESHICQVILNLCQNACDAMPAGGRLELRTREIEIDESEAELEPGPHVVLEVTDTGTGMSEQVRDMALEPFFTTKPLGQATGLGLSVVYGVVRECGGAVQIESARSEGTTVRVLIPTKRPANGESPSVSNLILLIESDPTSRRETASVLRKHGYGVVEASDGQQAMQQLQRSKPVLLLTELNATDASGQQLARTVPREYPNVGVLGMSEQTANVEDFAGVNVLQRPFAEEDLVAAVRRLTKPNKRGGDGTVTPG